MNLPRKLLSLLFLILLLAGSALAQERIVPVCPGIEIVDAPLGFQLQRFQKYKGFLQASLVAQPDSSYVLEVLYRPEAAILRERVTFTAAERAAFCTELQEAKGRNAEVQQNLIQEGRTELIRSSILYSLFYYGWAVPLAFDADDGRAYIASYMLIGGAGFFVPFLTTRNATVTEAMARGYTAGSFLGIAHGWALTGALMGEDIDVNAGLAISVVISLGEGVAGYQFAKKRNLNLGHMEMMGSGGLWGGAYGAVLPVFFNSQSLRTYSTVALVGSGAGIWLGHRLAGKHPISNGDTRVVNNAGLIGFVLAGAAASSVQSTSEKAIAGLLMVGSAAGLKIGLSKAIRHDYTESEGTLITLGSLAGGLVAVGTVYIAGGNSAGQAYMWGAGLGAAGGFALTDHLVRKKQVARQFGSLKIDFNPLALKSSTRQQSVRLRTGQLQNEPQLFRMSYQF